MRGLLLTGVSAGAILIGAVEASAADRISPVRVVDTSGHYFGLSLGWASVGGRIDDPAANYASAAGFADAARANAFLLGGKLGYDFRRRGPMVLGVEADVSALFGDNATCSQAGCVDTYPQLSFNVRGVGSLAGRLGWSPSSRSMFYGLFGVAVGAVQTNSYNSANYDGSHHLFTGWTAGLGWDVMVTSDISLGIEGRYYNLGTRTLVDSQDYAFAWNPTLWTLSVGAKHHF